MIEIIRNTLQAFCCEYVRNPYLCYTEHGYHALFFSDLLASIPESLRYVSFNGQKTCIVQKEYPTAGNLGKSQRQHWDIAVFETPLSSKGETSAGFDYLRLEAVIEFGLNSPEEHLRDDIARITNPYSNTMNGILVHLYRISDARSPFSKRDWSPRSKRILHKEEIYPIIENKPVEVFYAMADQTKTRESGAWLISPGKAIHPIA
jgi:hypothetical protein